MPSDCQKLSTLGSRSCSIPFPGLAEDNVHEAELMGISISSSESTGGVIFDDNSKAELLGLSLLGGEEDIPVFTLFKLGCDTQYTR